MCGEAAQGSRDVSRAALTKEGEQRVTQRGQCLRSRAAGYGAGVFTHAHVANAMELIFDGPMTARQIQQSCSVGAQPWETGNEANRFGCDNTFDRAFALDAADLFCAGKVNKRWNVRAGLDAAPVDPPVALVHRLRRTEVSLERLFFEGGAPRLRTRSQSRFEASSDCL